MVYKNDSTDVLHYTSVVLPWSMCCYVLALPGARTEEVENGHFVVLSDFSSALLYAMGEDGLSDGYTRHISGCNREILRRILSRGGV